MVPDQKNDEMNDGQPSDSMFGRVRSNIKKRIKNKVPGTGKDDLSDIAQDAVATAYEKIDQFQGRTYTQFMAWVYRIALNRCRDMARYWKRDCRDVGIEQPIVNDISKDRRLETSSIKLSDREREDMIEKAIASLPEKERLAIRLKHIENKTLKEISEIMNRSTDSVAGLLKRGMKKLKTSPAFRQSSS